MKTKPIQISEIAVIGIYVSNLQTAKQFYINELGFEDRGEMGPGYMLGMNNSAFYLEGGRDKNQSKRELKDADISICFTVPSVSRASEDVKKRNIDIVMPYTEYSPEYAMFMITDPDGNIIEFAGKP